MLMIKLLYTEELINAEIAFDGADSDNLVERSRSYLLLLNKYRDELYKLRGASEINIHQSSSLARELVAQTRKVIRSTVEILTRERNKIGSLIKSFTLISGYEAAGTFNRLEYKGYGTWELRANQVRLKNDEENLRFPIQEAVEIAAELRRTAYIAYKMTFCE